MRFHYVYASVLAVLGLAFAVPAAQAQTVLTAFNFNNPSSFQDSTFGAMSALVFTPKGNTNTSTTTAFNDTGMGTTTNRTFPNVPAGNAGKIIGGSNANGSSLTFGLNATNKVVGSLSFAIMSSKNGSGAETGFSTVQVGYKTDGSTTSFTLLPSQPISTVYAIDAFDLSGISGLSNNPSDQFQIIFSGAPQRNGNPTFNGSSSIDNLRVDSPAPEPSQMAGLAFFVLGLAGLSLRARKRAAAAV